VTEEVAAIFRGASHNSKQVSDLLLATLMRDEPAVLEPNRRNSRSSPITNSFLSLATADKSDSWRLSPPLELANFDDNQGHVVGERSVAPGGYAVEDRLLHSREW
jgi:hypothetical protein